jgi:hypothetical protein
LLAWRLNSKEGLHLLGALDLLVTLEARSPLFLLLLLVPLGEITPRWWWWWRWRWRRDRRTDAPLCTVGLGARLLGPTCGPLALLGRL